jgi:hypothetical protein
MKRPLCILLACVLCACSCDQITNEPALDQVVVSNCLFVVNAAKLFAAENGGAYPDRPDALVDYLPQSKRLENPAFHRATEPVFLEPTGIGSTSYRVFREYDDNGDFVVVGYYVVGRGESQDFVFTNIPDPEVHLQRERTVLNNCFLVRSAAEAFAAANDGDYSNGLADPLPIGDVLIDLLPGGRMLVNPYTGHRTEPRRGGATAPGEIGYQAFDTDADRVMDACLIEGMGSYSEPLLCSERLP